jgi:hypothetical protein
VGDWNRRPTWNCTYGYPRTHRAQSISTTCFSKLPPRGSFFLPFPSSPPATLTTAQLPSRIASQGKGARDDCLDLFPRRLCIQNVRLSVNFFSPFPSSPRTMMSYIEPLHIQTGRAVLDGPRAGSAVLQAAPSPLAAPSIKSSGDARQACVRIVICAALG